MNTALNGEWKKILCRDFDVRQTGVQIPGTLPTRINNILKRMPPQMTLGELVDMGHVEWRLYAGMGKACQEYLIAAINFVAGEKVVMKKSTSKSEIPTVRDDHRQMPRIVARGEEKPPERLDAVKEPILGLPPVYREPTQEEIAQRLAQKFSVSVHGKRLQESVATPVSRQLEHNRDMMTHGQLKRLCDGQSRRIESLELEKKFLVKELMDLKEGLARLLGK